MAFNPLTKGTVQDAWESFALSVIPKDAPRVQYQECRRAFFAGAYSTLCRFADIGTDAVSEDEGVEWLERLVAECKQFQTDVLAGRA